LEIPIGSDAIQLSGLIGAYLWSIKGKLFPSIGVENAKMIEVTDLSGLDTAFAASDAQPVLVLKHSTRCPISAGAYQRVAAWLDGNASAPAVYLVKVIESRTVSNAVAERLGVTHQSPQIILVRNGRAAWNASHSAITSTAIEHALSGQD
jgi:bacillithiol system protein YtxJ